MPFVGAYQSDLTRWSPRRAGMPTLLDWCPSYVALAALALFAIPIVGLIWVLVSTTVLAWRARRIELQRRDQRTRPWRPCRWRIAPVAR